MATMPARYVLERGQWADAAALALHPQSFEWERFPHAEASLVFARGLGAARAGDVDAARQELGRLAVLREAAGLENATEKHPVTPGPIAPAREMHLALEQPAEALVEYEASLLREPNRFRSLYGAARSDELVGYFCCSDFATHAAEFSTKRVSCPVSRDQ